MKTNNEEQLKLKLAECEARIEGSIYVHKAAQALLKIHDERLRQSIYETYAEYCEERWGISKTHAKQIIDVALMNANLARTTGSIPATESQIRELIGLTLEEQRKVWKAGMSRLALPANECQARELTGLTPDELRWVWQTAVETAPNGKITGAHIRETREALLGSRRDPVQDELFTLEDYQQAIKEYVDAANHHHREGKHHRREKRRHRLEAIRLRDEAFKKFGVQLDLPFEFGDQNTD